MTLKIHGIKVNGIDSLTGKEGEVLVASTEDGFLNSSEISIKSLMNIIRMKVGQNGKPVPIAEAVNGSV